MASADDLVSTQKGGVQNLGKLAQYWQQFVAPGQTTSTTPSPKPTIVTAIATASVSVIGTSTVRRGLQFFNPIANGVNIYLMPSLLTAVINQGVLLVPGGSFSIPSTLSASQGWNAIAASGTASVVTVLEFF